MNLETVPLRRLSICPCGFPVLEDDIRLGTRYRIDRASVRSRFDCGCGGCKTVHHNVTVVNASSVRQPDAPFRPLPLELFERVQ